MRKTASAIALFLMTIPAFAAPLKLEPASPQPSGLKSGLAVKYAEASVRKLSDAARVADSAKPGPALAGLDYWDTTEGEETLTAGRAMAVVAVIDGYVRFDAPGTYTIDFLSNDGLQMSIGGQQVAFHDGVHGCTESKAVQAEVPVAGWYELEGLYFQRKGTACLHMRAGMGSVDWMPDSAFGH